MNNLKETLVYYALHEIFSGLVNIALLHVKASALISMISLGVLFDLMSDLDQGT